MFHLPCCVPLGYCPGWPAGPTPVRARPQESPNRWGEPLQSRGQICSLTPPVGAGRVGWPGPALEETRSSSHDITLLAHGILQVPLTLQDKHGYGLGGAGPQAHSVAGFPPGGPPGAWLTVLETTPSLAAPPLPSRLREWAVKTACLIDPL